MKTPVRRSIYEQPLRVYIILAALVLAGVYSGLSLPVSLFPNSSKPKVFMSVNYGSLATEEFKKAYGDGIEQSLLSMKLKGRAIEVVESEYGSNTVNYVVNFPWGLNPDDAQKEVEAVLNSWRARLPKESRDGSWVGMENENSGFFAASFFSNQRGPDEIYRLVDDAIGNAIRAVPDANAPEIWNPARKEISVTIKPDVMVRAGIMPRDIEIAILRTLESRSGGSVTSGRDNMTIEMPRQFRGVEDLNNVLIRVADGRVLPLRDVADVTMGVRTGNTKVIKTSGAPSVIVFSTPKPGANIKRMSDDMRRIIESNKHLLPADVQYKVLVDPSEFIRSAVNNVFHEVLLGAILAVSVLFVFIGSFRNVVTAAIEIPMSIILAFILMAVSGVNVNLISLGGLALSAGMNVDASVVVMENIFRHFAMHTNERLTLDQKVMILRRAVSEVRMPLVASTIASLVVFLPLAFTSDLSYALLGDLAKTVVFSHGFSAIVALILVPTVRFHLMSRSTVNIASHEESIFEPYLQKLEKGYGRMLMGFLESVRLRTVVYIVLPILLIGMSWFVLPRLKQEVIGTPDSDMIFLAMNARGNTLIGQMEQQSGKIERDMLDQFGDAVAYTFTQVGSAGNAWILIRLKNKSDMDHVWKGLEKTFTNTPDMKFYIGPWNPSELPIPHPPEVRVEVRGGDAESRRALAQRVADELEKAKVADRVRSEPSVEMEKMIQFRQDPLQWEALAKKGISLQPSDLMDLSRVMSGGRAIEYVQIDGRNLPINLEFPQGMVQNLSDLLAFPVRTGEKIVPFSALLKAEVIDQPATPYNENGEGLVAVFASLNESNKTGSREVLPKAKAVLAKLQETIESERAADPAKYATAKRSVFSFADPGKDVTKSIHQLGWAIGFSVVLIFLVLIIQFGTVMDSLLVLVAIPLGLVGVLLALFSFGSTLSLNSALGVILLNGIAVNNSILLVDFMRRLVDSGHDAKSAALQAGTKRLRPILITSLTTLLGMLPIAFGFGEGGKILQPLGIAVCGGLWVSTGMTLFIVPALQCAWQERRQRHSVRKQATSADPLRPLSNFESLEQYP